MPYNILIRLISTGEIELQANDDKKLYDNSMQFFRSLPEEAKPTIINELKNKNAFKDRLRK